MRILILYATFSGNTEEVAEIISDYLKEYGHEVVLSRNIPEDFESFDLLLLGTFNWGKGRVPDVMKRMVAEIGPKHDNVAIFGSGDSQFGKYYGMAIKNLANYYSSKYPALVVEQSPRGYADEGVQLRKINEWVQEVLRIAKN